MYKDDSSFVGPAFGRNNPTGNKILAADGVPGIIMMLAYYAGGHNIFPPSITVPMFLIGGENLEPGCVMTDLSLLSELQNSLFQWTGHQFGQLSRGSLPIYLTLLRQGWRANRTGRFPEIKTKCPPTKGTVIIWPRSYEQDVISGVYNLVPLWVRNLDKQING